MDKNLSSTHQDLAWVYNDIIRKSENAPMWGVTYLLPKTEETQNSKNYRPITCLPTMYKILPSVITKRKYNFVEQNRRDVKEDVTRARTN